MKIPRTILCIKIWCLDSRIDRCNTYNLLGTYPGRHLVHMKYHRWRYLPYRCSLPTLQTPIENHRGNWLLPATWTKHYQHSRTSSKSPGVHSPRYESDVKTASDNRLRNQTYGTKSAYTLACPRWSLGSLSLLVSPCHRVFAGSWSRWRHSHRLSHGRWNCPSPARSRDFRYRGSKQSW